MYAKLEEDYGLARHAMSIYDRATRAVQDSDKFEVFIIYIARATDYFGVTNTREIYERAIASLPDNMIKKMCLKYADLEKKLGEIDRARAVYAHAAQYCDPRIDHEFWKLWHDFEVQHGNEDTFREMLRIKRSVQAQFNTQVNFMTAEMLAASKAAEAVENEQKRKKYENDMEALERLAEPVAPRTVGTVQFTKGPTLDANLTEKRMEALSKLGASPEEININEEGDMEEGPEEINIEQIQVPSAVFGEDDEPLGALDRIKKKKK